MQNLNDFHCLNRTVAKKRLDMGLKMIHYIVIPNFPSPKFRNWGLNKIVLTNKSKATFCDIIQFLTRPI